MCDISKSVEYTQETMDVALEKVKKIEANLGGTEILKPLEQIFSQACVPGQPRQVMEFTQCRHIKVIIDGSTTVKGTVFSRKVSLRQVLL